MKARWEMRGLPVETLGRRGALQNGSMWAIALLLLSLLGIWLVWAPPAHAGKWVQVTCPQSHGSFAFTEGWQHSLGGLGAGSGTSDMCQEGGTLTAFDSSTTEETAYTGPLWTYTAPAGSTIAGGTVAVAMRTPQGQAYVATPQNDYTSEADLLVNCQYNTPPCATSGFAGTVSITHSGGTELFMGAFCVAPHEKELKCPVGSGGGVNAEIHLAAADIELKSESKPNGTDFAGSLLQPNATGTAHLTFTATDLKGPGVYRLIVDVDGSAVYEGTPDSNDGQCASIGEYASGVREFLSPQPCEQELKIDVPVDTSKLTNGKHQLQVTVQDAAGNSTTPYDEAISIANTSGGGGHYSHRPR